MLAADQQLGVACLLSLVLSFSSISWLSRGHTGYWARWSLGLSKSLGPGGRGWGKGEGGGRAWALQHARDGPCVPRNGTENAMQPAGNCYAIGSLCFLLADNFSSRIYSHHQANKNI